MDSSSIEDLAAYFNDKLATLNTVCELRNAGNNPQSGKHLSSIEDGLQSLKLTMAYLKEEVKKQKEQLKTIEEVKKNFDRLMKDLQYTSSNIPQRLPNTNQNSSEKDMDTTNKTSSQTVSIPSSKLTNKDKTKKISTKKHCPTIEYLTVDEFNEVPKYLKGRMAYNQINSVIDELNKTFTSKYKILHMKKTTMNDVCRKNYDNYKSQETKETEGVFFVVEADIKEFSSIKMDAVARSILTILRHCGRMREIRGGKITRYAIIESY